MGVDHLASIPIAMHFNTANHLNMHLKWTIFCFVVDRQISLWILSFHSFDCLQPCQVLEKCDRSIVAACSVFPLHEAEPLFEWMNQRSTTSISWGGWMVVESTWNSFISTSTRNVNHDKHEMGDFGDDVEIVNRITCIYTTMETLQFSKSTTIEVLW